MLWWSYDGIVGIGMVISGEMVTGGCSMICVEV
jgi:6,7-dimethyl-8-ribityllumazine synthase